ncbi:hypothetical protein [uncultured Roseibium sp.]|uniref:hypothetical protein n=1 Tax=uncultured Roseibium sp. TaxID=1936171 RepID=UPI002626414D|nr:hypothetical protein [uncultured Roseibium sp.]
MAPDLTRKIILASLFLVFAANSALAQSRCPTIFFGYSNHKTCNELLRDRKDKDKNELTASTDLRVAEKAADPSANDCAVRAKEKSKDSLSGLPIKK